MGHESRRTSPAPEVLARDALDRLLEGCQIIDRDWTYRYVNETVCAQAQRTREELLGRTMMECFPGIEQTPMFAALRRCLIERLHLHMENEFTFPDGSKGWFDLRFVPVPEGVCVLSLDVTDAKRTALALARSEEQLRHAQKMEAVGRLAGGVAHDFNNLLSVIMGYSSLLVADLPPDSPLRGDLEEIQRAGERAAELTRQLLAFSRQQAIEPRVVDLNEILDGMAKMIRRLVGEHIRVERALEPHPWRVRADPGQVEQVVMNLVVNAVDAMPDGGTLTLETQNVDLDEGYSAGHLGTTTGPHVMLAVSDTGVGMDKATQEKIFEPFFTTKELGKGTGLGLSTVFGIVRQNGGNIWVYSEPGQGATFKVFFPRTDEVPVDSRAHRPFSVLSGDESILVVEDDPQVRAVVQGILGRSGYTVCVASGGDEALRILETDAPLHLLLVDAVMPGLTGRQVAERAAVLRPALPALFMSGYTEHASPAALPPGAPRLQKPITPLALLRKVRELLGAKGS